MRLQQENSYFCVIRVGPLNGLPELNEFCHFYLHGVCDKEICSPSCLAVLLGFASTNT
jgi:hypothetical protein